MYYGAEAHIVAAPVTPAILASVWQNTKLKVAQDKVDESVSKADKAQAMADVEDVEAQQMAEKKK